ncbi:MAG TPA: hypothetical protein VE127_12695, partial [Solirubrobacteraceae bacterium]|nr:hypothetical protein [Solirubrobacteraceae bacterium]
MRRRPCAPAVMRKCALTVAALLGVLAGSVGTAHAANTLTVDFETGPAVGTAITTEYESSAFTTFQQADPAGGFRPARRTVSPGLAHSGTTVADIGADRCQSEVPPPVGNQCEFPTGGTTGRLDRTVQTVTVYAGLFDAPFGPVTGQLIGHLTGGGTVTGTAESLSTAGFDTAVTVTSNAGDIAYWTFVIGGSGAVGANVGIDDLTYTFTNALPDISPSAPGAVEAVGQGMTTDVPVTVARLNGSSGNVQLSAGGLPAGVTATFTPNPLPATQTSAVMHLTASGTAPPFFAPQTATVTADPQANASVAPAPRTTTLLMKVVSSFDLQATAQTPDPAQVPACTSVDVPFTLARDGSFGGSVTLSVAGLPAGVTADLLPSSTIPAGGDLNVPITLRLHGSTTRLPLTQIQVRATSPGSPDRVLPLRLITATPSATLQQTLGDDPRFQQPGTNISIAGNGFCPGTTVLSNGSSAPADVSADGHSLSFDIPRGAATGRVEILPPAPLAAYLTTNSLTVQQFLGQDAFAFPNFAFGNLSLSELTDEFGADDLFIKVNPCWPLGDCTVVTGILNPIAAVAWGLIDVLLRNSGGHCFGMSRGVQELVAGWQQYNRFDAGVSTPFGLTGPSGPSSE